MIVCRYAPIVAVAALAAACAHPSHNPESPDRTRAPYQFPLTSPGAQFATLTPPVQNAIRAQVGGAEISTIIKDRLTGRTVVHFVNAALLPPLHIAPDGSVLTADSMVAVGAPGDESVTLMGGAAAGLKPSDMPLAVSDTVRQKAPGVPLANISKETWGNQPVYIITFPPESGQPRLYVSSDGAVLHQNPR